MSPGRASGDTKARIIWQVWPMVNDYPQADTVTASLNRSLKGFVRGRVGRIAW